MSAPNDLTLSDLELDALTELVNIGVGKAATALRDMVGKQVLLSVPNVSLVTRPRAIELLYERETSKLVAVHQAFEGDIAGRVLLIFPDTKSLELVRAVAGENLSLEDIMELESEALAEIGNVILNGCLATIANMLHRNLKISLPEIVRGDGAELFAVDDSSAKPGDAVLFLYINFAVQVRDIRGYIAMLMDMHSLAALKDLIRDFIARTTGDAERS